MKTICWLHRCKLILDRKPRAAGHENVLPFPVEIMSAVLGRIMMCSFCFHVKFVFTARLSSYLWSGDDYEIADVSIQDPPEAMFPISRKRKYVLLLRKDMKSPS